MKNLKHTHTIMINTIKTRYKTYTYNFGNTKDITLDVGKNAITITATLRDIYNKKEMLSSGCYLFPDAIKKALLLHLIIFSENITIKNITVSIDDETETIWCDKENCTPPIYSMTIGKLKRSFINDWQNDATINGILKQTKSSYDSRMAALFALICSKSKIYEAERFIYLWMSLNGMYGYFSKLISEYQNIKAIRRECDQIKHFQKLYSFGNETIIEDDKKRIADMVISLIEKNNTVITYDSLSKGEHKNLSQSIKDILTNSKTGEPYYLNSYGYLITQFAYYFRCNIIHANKPVALFAYEDEKELKCLQTINNLLEEFIDNHLYKWFNQEFEENELISKATNIKIK